MLYCLQKGGLLRGLNSTATLLFASVANHVANIALYP